MFKIGDKVRIKKIFYSLWASWCHDATIEVTALGSREATIVFTKLKREKYNEGYVFEFPKSRLDTEFERVGPPEFTVKVEYRTTDVDEATTFATQIATAIGKPVSVTHV